MTDAAIANIGSVVQEARELSVQSRARQDVEYRFGFLPWGIASTFIVAPWWSEQRDRDLRNFWKQSDHLSGALYNMVSKMDAIPFVIAPDDPNDERQVEAADMFHRNLMYAAEYGQGWHAFYTKWLEDLLSTDNGAFAEVIGRGDPAGPLEGMPITIAHLDSGRCQRTGHPEYPVLYRDRDGQLSKLHWTRVLYSSQMTSPIEEMNGVGFCSVSRVINVAQTLVDILIYKQEKLGSRPHRSILVSQGGLDPDDIGKAFEAAELEMDAMGLSRYARTVIVGDASIPDGNIIKVDLSSLPDGYDEEKSTVMGMAIIALGFGVDARDLFPSMGAGSTRADALLQHIKQRGKGPGQIIQAVESSFNFKYLPDFLKMRFDMQDDAEDRQKADIAQVRSMRRERDMVSGVTNVKIEHQRMLSEGEISESQYAELELMDGRLRNGASVISLFYTEKEPFKSMLDLGVEDPARVYEHGPEVLLPAIDESRARVYEYQSTVKNSDENYNAVMALAALDFLEKEVNKNKMSNLGNESEEDNLPEGMLGDRFQQKDPMDLEQTEQMRTDFEADPTVEQKQRFEAVIDKFDRLLEVDWDE